MTRKVTKYACRNRHLNAGGLGFAYSSGTRRNAEYDSVILRFGGAGAGAGAACDGDVFLFVFSAFSLTGSTPLILVIYYAKQ